MRRKRKRVAIEPDWSVAHPTFHCTQVESESMRQDGGRRRREEELNNVLDADFSLTLIVFNLPNDRYYSNGS